MDIHFRFFCATFFVLGLHLFVGCNATGTHVLSGKPAEERKPVVTTLVSPLPVAPKVTFPIMLGIDVLESEGFVAVKGKRLGLLTHPAGVNRRGVRTVDVLRGAAGVELIELFAVEHGLEDQLAAEKPFEDSIDKTSGLKVISLYKGHVVKPTPAQLKLIDAMVIDLQDIGARSYTFSGAMKTVMEACFQNGKEVIVLDRPNPLGGLKVSGPLLDPDQMSDVGRFRVPYVHGLTMGELARMVQYAYPPGGLDLSDAARAKSKLTVIPMRGWSRAMLWPDTGLKWIPTSGSIQDFAAVEGYPMTGLGCILGGFRHGIAHQLPFRGIAHPEVKPISERVLEKDLTALKLPGIKFNRRTVAGDKTAPPTDGIYIDITDYDTWRPTDLNFYLMQLACKYESKNPFATATAADRRTFKVHVGSSAFFDDLARRGQNVDVASWLAKWREQDGIYQSETKKYWLYQ